MLQTQVLIIGGGITGTGLARDLAMRGVRSILVEQKDLNAGASGANHGLLHSGARYVSNDPTNGTECCEEGRILKQMAPHCIEDTGGLFVAVEGDDERYVASFPQLCAQCNIPVKMIDAKDAREMEPAISEKLIAAYMVEDASVDPFKLSMENFLQAQDLDSWLDGLQETMPGELIFIYDACRSGTFLLQMIPPAGKQRIVITSASDENAYFIHQGGLSFSFQFWAYLYGGYELYDAFVHGKPKGSVNIFIGKPDIVIKKANGFIHNR